MGDWGSQLSTGIKQSRLSRKEPSFIDIKGFLSLIWFLGVFRRHDDLVNLSTHFNS